MDAKLASFRAELLPGKSLPVEKAKKKGKGAGDAGEASGEPSSAPRPTPVVPSTAAAPSTSAPAATSSSGPAATAPSLQEETWATVVGRRAKKTAKKVAAAAAVPPPATAEQRKKKGPAMAAPPSQVPTASQKAKYMPGRPPRTAAVTLTVPPGSKTTYAEAMTLARAKVNIADLGIASVRPRRAVTGAMILEVPGQEGAAKADIFAEKIREALAGTDVRVARPVKTAELRIRGLEDSIRPGEVAAAVAAAGDCPLGEVKTGEVRFSPGGLGTIWVRCPLRAARAIAGRGRLQVGWTSVRVEALPPRPLQCYKCLEGGHVAMRCCGSADRTGLCYRCGDAGHRVVGCAADQPNCPHCAGLGKPAAHRIGSEACASTRASTSRGVRGAATAVTAAVVPPLATPCPRPISAADRPATPPPQVVADDGTVANEAMETAA